MGFFKCPNWSALVPKMGTMRLGLFLAVIVAQVRCLVFLKSWKNILTLWALLVCLNGASLFAQNQAGEKKQLAAVEKAANQALEAAPQAIGLPSASSALPTADSAGLKKNLENLKVVNEAAKEGPASKETALEESEQPLLFYAWKSRKIEVAIDRIVDIKKQIERAKKNNVSSPPTNEKVKELEKLLKDLQLREEALVAARALAISDYVEMHLINQSEATALIEKTAASLKPKEVAELLKSYLNSLKRTE